MAELLEEQELDEAQLGETQPDEAQPDEAQLGETQLGEAQLDETQLGETQLGETQPDEAQLDETQLGETQLGETQPDEAQLDETQLDETDEEEFALEEIGDNLGFLRDTSDNLNLYEAFQAYHEHRNFEDAIKKFRAAAAYERRHGASSEAGSDENPNATLVKCLYWLAESHNKLEQRNKAIKAFETLAKDFDSHYLGMAAQRRAETLKAEA